MTILWEFWDKGEVGCSKMRQIVCPLSWIALVNVSEFAMYMSLYQCGYTQLDFYSPFQNLPLWIVLNVGDKVSMFTHTYPHKHLRKIKVTICSHQADSPLYVWPDVWSGDLQVWKSMVIHDTECPYWDQVSLNDPNPNPTEMCSQRNFCP